VTLRPSSLFSLFFPKIYSERQPLCRRNPRLRPIGSRKNSGALRCSSLFLIVIEIAQNFTVFRTVAEYGPASPPVLAENLQGLLFVTTTEAALNTTAIRHSCEMESPAVMCQCKLLQKYAIVN